MWNFIESIYKGDSQFQKIGLWVLALVFMLFSYLSVTSILTLIINDQKHHRWIGFVERNPEVFFEIYKLEKNRSIDSKSMLESRFKHRETLVNRLTEALPGVVAYRQDDMMAIIENVIKGEYDEEENKSILNYVQGTE